MYKSTHGPLPTTLSFGTLWNDEYEGKVQGRPWIKQFWDASDNAKSGYKSNGVVIGQTWDGPAISMKKAAEPVSYQARGGPS